MTKSIFGKDQLKQLWEINLDKCTNFKEIDCLSIIPMFNTDMILELNKQQVTEYKTFWGICYGTIKTMKFHILLIPKEHKYHCVITDKAKMFYPINSQAVAWTSLEWKEYEILREKTKVKYRELIDDYTDKLLEANKQS